MLCFGAEKPYNSWSALRFRYSIIVDPKFIAEIRRQNPSCAEYLETGEFLDYPIYCLGYSIIQLFTWDETPQGYAAWNSLIVRAYDWNPIQIYDHKENTSISVKTFNLRNQMNYD